MKKIFGLCLCLLFVAGCGKVPTLKNGEEAVVSFKNGDMISVDALYEKVKSDYALDALMTLVDTMVLEDAFPDYIETAKKNAENYVNAMREGYETEEEFLYAISYYTGMSTIEAYEESMYLSYMQSHAAEEYAKDQITEKEIEDYYKNDVVGDIEVSHILITPDTNDKMSDEDISKAEKAAKDKAQGILDELKKLSGEELTKKFAELAKENSEDTATKENGGSLGKINKATMSSNYDELVEAAYKLKDGKLHTSVVTTELGYHIILKTATHEKATLEASKESILNTLSSALLNEGATLPITALQYYRDEVGLKIEDSELQKQFSNAIQNQLTMAQSSTEAQ